MPLLKTGNFLQVAGITRDSGTAIGTILSYGLDRVRSARRREDIEQAMEESLMEVVPRLERRTHYLATFANIATLLGLLGTVMGLIEAFTAVASVEPCREGEHAVVEHLGGDERHGLRSRRRHPAAARAQRAHEQDDAHRRQPRDGGGEVPEQPDRAHAGGARPMIDAPQDERKQQPTPAS